MLSWRRNLTVPIPKVAREEASAGTLDPANRVEAAIFQATSLSLNASRAAVLARRALVPVLPSGLRRALAHPLLRRASVVLTLPHLLPLTPVLTAEALLAVEDAMVATTELLFAIPI